MRPAQARREASESATLRVGGAPGLHPRPAAASGAVEGSGLVAFASPQGLHSLKR
jgi:hypothetical protein